MNDEKRKVIEAETVEVLKDRKSVYGSKITSKETSLQLTEAVMKNLL